MSPEIGTRWSAEADRVLRLAEWFPGRSVSTAAWEKTLHEHGGFEIHDAARRFLTEFGGLAFDLHGPGITMAQRPFTLDPLAAEWDDEIFDVLSDEAGAYLYPIGETSRRNSYLGMTANGAVYWGMDDVRLLADTADQALDCLIRGIAGGSDG
jgi:hypothetical protein